MRAASLYRGSLFHRRLKPAHSFRRDLMMACVDVEEIDAAESGTVRLSRVLPLGIRRQDHLPDAKKTLAQRVRELVLEGAGYSPMGRMLLVSQPRAFGLTFNPVSFIFCLEAGTVDVIECVIAEVTNTPWGERHAYVLAEGNPSGSGARHFSATKAMHVSPFFGMDHEYDFGFAMEKEQIQVTIVNRQNDRVVFEVGLSMARMGEAQALPFRALLRHALMPFETVWGIYAQAARLAMKRVPFFVHPRKHKPGPAPAPRPADS